jgi:hypothetical protein
MTGSVDMFPDRPWPWSLQPPDDFVAAFLAPALDLAHRYDRIAGFFASSVLVVAAKGIEHLVRHVPRAAWPIYRILACEQLSPDDVAAIEQGLDLRRSGGALEGRLLAALDHPPDAAARDRLALLAALVAVGACEIRVAVPKGPDGKVREGAIEHAKVAILHDAADNVLVGFGSANESWHGWRYNNEELTVFASWDEPAWSRYGQPRVDRFARMWIGADPASLTYDLPEAVRHKLVRFAPERLPAILLPPEPPSRRPLFSAAEEAVIKQFLRDAPYLPGGERLGMATAGVEPWPHHVGLVEVTTRRSADLPPRYLLCDEVGLGKTAEAAFTIRQLLLDGRARRILILAPSAVLPQWQDELREKFNLWAPIYTGSELVHPERQAAGSGPGRKPSEPADARAAFGGDRCLVLAGSQLMRRADRQNELLAAPPWDVVVVDEAHHARRQGYARPEPPNRLLRLLQDLRDRTGGLLLLTATPMQIDPLEVWDLLRLVHLAGDFERSYAAFRRYYSELARVPLGSADLGYLVGVVRSRPERDSASQEAARRAAPALVSRLRHAETNEAVRRQLAPYVNRNVEAAYQYFLAAAPTRLRMFRATRATLREYRRQGLIRENVPERGVKLVTLPLASGEQQVYDEIDRYLSRHYVNAVANDQRGLGFVLTSYRRRLTSSMFAVRKSLTQRRARLLAGTVRVRDLVGDDDIRDQPEPDSDDDVLDATAAESVDARAQATAEIDDLLRAMDDLGEQDSKYICLIDQIQRLTLEHPRIIVFTQYVDTLDYLRRRLVVDLSPRIACYSGRGGEVYDSEADRWIEVSKDEIKAGLARENGTRILVCTDAAAEGLNLQACGALVNYDMPWNPMRVEQRIGRIDRIGQLYQTVQVRNFFYENTIEDSIYRILDARINLFEQFVGPLQPILVTVQQAIQKVAMTPSDQRAVVQQEQLAEVEAAINALEEEAPSLPVESSFVRGVAPQPVPIVAPVDLVSLEEACLRLPSLLDPGALRDCGDRTFEIRSHGRLLRITFDRAKLAERAEGLRLFSFGDPAFDAFLSDGAPSGSDLSLLGLVRETSASPRAVRWLKSGREIASLTELLGTLDG